MESQPPFTVSFVFGDCIFSDVFFLYNFVINNDLTCISNIIEKLQEKEDEIKELVRSVEQLRSYIGEIRPSQETQQLSDLNKQMTNTVQVMTEENDTLHSTVKLLNVRLSSMLEIVAIQETELTRNYEEVGTSRGSQGLLQKWREKVFALMVQLQCQRIVKCDQKRVDTVQVGLLFNN